MTNTIDYVKYFKNYNFINDYCYSKDDYISEMLIKNYQTSIYNTDINNKNDVKLMKKIDNIMKIYIMDLEFFEIIQKKLKDMNDNYIQDLNTILSKEYDNFQNSVGVISTSRWI